MPEVQKTHQNPDSIPGADLTKLPNGVYQCKITGYGFIYRKNHKNQILLG